MQLSIVIPALNEAKNIVPTLHALAAVRRSDVEVVVVDGGSTDETVKLAEPLADCVIHAPAGRATQMNHGAAVARGQVLLFLHADTRLPPNGVSLVLDGLHKADQCWGRFNVAIESWSPLLKLVAAMMNLRGNIYFPLRTVHPEYLQASDKTTQRSWKGMANYYHVVVNGETNRDAAWVYHAPKDAAKQIEWHVAFWQGVEVQQ